MKIKEGMYVRTKKGIAKYLGLGINVLKDDGSRSYNHWKSKHIFDNYIFDEEYGDTLTTLDNIDKIIVGEPSFDIIDLIEVGDYVNGYKVVQIGKSIEDRKYVTTEAYHKINYGNIFENDIESIVTKESFKNAEYRVETN